MRDPKSRTQQQERTKMRTEKEIEDMYKQVCDIEGCDKVLDINENIHIWTNKKEDKEMTICNDCHEWFYQDLKQSGYSCDDLESMWREEDE